MQLYGIRYSSKGYRLSRGDERYWSAINYVYKDGAYRVFSSVQQAERFWYESGAGLSWNEYDFKFVTLELKDYAVLFGADFPTPWGFVSGVHYGMHLHVDPEDPTKVRFLDPAKNYIRMVSMKPGKFLKKFCHDMDDKKIAYMAEWFKIGQRPDVDIAGLEFGLAHTADEIEEVYDTGPSSCMDGEHDWKYDAPVRAYAGGDLAVAHLMALDGTIVARALCYPEGKAFSRVYTSDYDEAEAADVDTYFVKMMKGMGWTSLDEDGKGFDNVRMAEISYLGALVYPYLDRGTLYRDPDGQLRLNSTNVDAVVVSSSSTTGGYIKLSYHCDMPPCPPEIAERARKLQARKDMIFKSRERAASEREVANNCRTENSRLRNRVHALEDLIEDMRREYSRGVTGGSSRYHTYTTAGLEAEVERSHGRSAVLEIYNNSYSSQDYRNRLQAFLDRWDAERAVPVTVSGFERENQARNYAPIADIAMVTSSMPGHLQANMMVMDDTV